MTKTKVALGVDIGGTNTLFGLIDMEGNIYFKESIPTQSHQPAEQLFQRLFGEYRELLTNEEKYQLIGIGIGAPNGNYYKGTVEHPPNLSWGVVNVVDIIKKHINLPVIITNDANAAALGEMIFGAAQGMKNFVEITLGTGLGSGIVVNGQVVYGHDGFAGEIGHTTIQRNGRLCGCGKKGCLETYASATGIVTTAVEMLNSPKYSTLPNCLRDFHQDHITAKNIFNEAIKGNDLAIEAFQYTGQILGEALANTVSHLSPEAIILFGGLAQAGDLLLKYVKEHLEKNVFPIFRNKVKIIPSQLPAGDAAILGASALVFTSLA
jgi:glucokinase